MKNSSPLPASLIADLGVQLGIASQLYIGLMSRLLEPYDMTYPQFALLTHLLRRKSAARISDMAEAVELTQSAVTKAVQKFALMGLVDVQGRAEDKRSRFVSMTQAGQRRMAEIQAQFGPAFADMLQGWNENEVARLSGDLARVIAWLDAQPRLGKSEDDGVIRSPSG